MLDSARYRLSQLGASVFVRLDEADWRWVKDTLSETERPLFDRMPAFDQVHSVRVAREVAAAGGDEYLLRAALLHDCGKTLPPHRIPLPYRGLVVLIRALSTRLLRLLARPWGPLWPVYLNSHHPQLGAEALEQVGSPPEVVALVRNHQQPSSDPRLSSLQAADERH